MRPTKDITGQRYGRWTVLRKAERNKHNRAMWLCRCACGQEANVRGHALRSGNSQQCRSCATREQNKTHGGCGTRLYAIWTFMRRRCNNENRSGFKYYGGRGIRVCAEWDTFEAFRDWALANGYKQGLSIDRIDNDGDYEPGNCRWATSKEQSRNRRNNVHIVINGITRTIVEWAEVVGIKYDTLRARVERGWSGERLISPAH